MDLVHRHIAPHGAGSAANSAEVLSHQRLPFLRVHRVRRGAVAGLEDSGASHGPAIEPVHDYGLVLDLCGVEPRLRPHRELGAVRRVPRPAPLRQDGFRGRRSRTRGRGLRHLLLRGVADGEPRVHGASGGVVQGRGGPALAHVPARDADHARPRGVAWALLATGVDVHQPPIHALALRARAKALRARDPDLAEDLHFAAGIGGGGLEVHRLANELRVGVLVVLCASQFEVLQHLGRVEWLVGHGGPGLGHLQQRLRVCGRARLPIWAAC
mmetsp:Transcript_36563/g.102157  ORF Transcript_36563/g.102157 Transcript_36563/m.102157 type:complete len:270 (-) Transcript_36563:125-934(-)